MLKAIIVENESKSRNLLKQMLEEYCTSVTVVASAEDVLNGVKEINAHQPDVVFLDIEMPNYSGFKLIEFFDPLTFEIVFTSAFEKYAHKAFAVSAIDYLLKPIDIDELIGSVNRVKEKKAKSEKIKLANADTSPSGNKRFILPAQNGLLYVHVDEIAFLESDGRYTFIHLKNGEKLKTTRNLKECELVFEKSTLIRVHRSFMINLLYIRRYARGKDNYIVLENNVKVDVGKNYKEEFVKILDHFLT